MSAGSARTCVADFYKYYDTLTVSAAISHLFTTCPKLGHFVGVEHKLVTTDPSDILTPDLTVVYDNASRGLLFELKYSLPSDVRSVKDELMKLAKYSRAYGGWGVSGPVQLADFVLVCHMDDVHRAVEAATQIFDETQNPFYDPRNFSIWTWTSTSRKGERKEEMRLLHTYGATSNVPLQQMIKKAGGIPVAEEVLTTLRFTQVFLRQKPPVQYTMHLLIQNVFSALPRRLGADRTTCQVDLDLIYRNANILFPPWWESDVQTIQVKRRWLKEALDTLARLRLVKPIPDKVDSYVIPIPTLRTRKQMELAICERLAAMRRPPGPEGVRVYLKKVPRKRSPEDRLLTDFLTRQQPSE